MSGWISSKLKVAETLLQQIDQQAAESLGKNENPRSDEANYKTPTKVTEILPLKDQLKKKTPENNDLVGKLHNDRNLNVINNSYSRNLEKEVATPLNLNPKSSLTDSDWTELLSAPNKNSPQAANRNNGVSGVRSLRKDGRKQWNSGSNLSSFEGKRSPKAQNSVVKSSRKSDVSESKTNGCGLDGRPSDGEDSRFLDSIRSTSSVELRNYGENLERRELDRKDANASIFMEHRSEANEERNGGLDTLRDGKQLHSKDCSIDGVSHSMYETRPSVMVSSTVDGVSDVKTGVNDDHNRFRSAMGRNEDANAGPRSSATMKRGSLSTSDAGSDSETDSASTSDSESEREREERKRRRAQILAEKAAAKAIEAIKERENMVARLEGEKQSLEKILEERANQQAQEASELQMTMMETMEAVDLEKQKHNNTRMEALTILAKLETANADLARSLATAQWNLEVEVNRVAELRQQFEVKERTHEELKRKISSTHQTGNNLVASKGVEFEREILEAEYTFITDKVRRLQEKAKALEEGIETTCKEIENPTVVEVELKRRLGLLTDHLIQKQSQAEALSSEKSMLLFRIEAVSRMLDENKSMPHMTDLPSTSSREDLESGIWERSNSKLRPMFEERFRSGQKHLGSLFQQLDSIFSAGVVFLRRNSTARIWALIYLVCLHLWVLYILMSHSPVSEEARFGAIVSLENLNNTGSV